MSLKSLCFPGCSVVNNPPTSAGDARAAGLIPESGRSTMVGHSNPLQYSCLENPRDRGVWWAAVPEFAKRWMQHTHTHTHKVPKIIKYPLYLKVVLFLKK